MVDLLRVEANERVDLIDFQYLANEVLTDALRDQGRGFLTNPNGAVTTWILGGFAMTSSAGKQLTVTKGRALLGYRVGGATNFGMLTLDGDASKTIDMTSLTLGTYNVYIRFEYLDTTSTSRVFWDPAGTGQEFTQTVPTRLQANWSLRVETSSPGAEWTKIGTADNNTAPLTLVDMRKFYFEGAADASYASGWSTDGGGGANDRNANRQTYGNLDLQSFTAATRQCLEDIKGRGLRRWWSRDIGGMNIGFDANPVEDRLAIGDADMCLQWSSGLPALQMDAGGDALVYDRTNNFWQFKIGNVEEMRLGATGLAISNGLYVGDVAGTPILDNNIYAEGLITGVLGVLGQSTGSGTGVRGEGGAAGGTGVEGQAGYGSSGSWGVHGLGYLAGAGVYGAGGATGPGVEGLGGTNIAGVKAIGNGIGVGLYAIGGNSGGGVGVDGYGAGNPGLGVRGTGSGGGPGVRGQASAIGPGVDAYSSGSGPAMYAINTGTGYGLNALSYGVLGAVVGQCQGTGPGVDGYGTGAGTGVRGTGGGSSGTGVEGQGGVSNGIGVLGTGDGIGPGVRGYHTHSGSIGVHGYVTGVSGIGIKGESITTGNGVEGYGAVSGYGMMGVGGTTGGGVWGRSGTTDGSAGVVGSSRATNGKGGSFSGTGTGTGLESDTSTTTGYAAYFTGNATRSPLHLDPVNPAPTTPTVGDFYVNHVTHHVYCYLNGSWRQLDN